MKSINSTLFFKRFKTFIKLLLVFGFIESAAAQSSFGSPAYVYPEINTTSTYLISPVSTTSFSTSAPLTVEETQIAVIEGSGAEANFASDSTVCALDPLIDDGFGLISDFGLLEDLVATDLSILDEPTTGSEINYPSEEITNNDISETGTELHFASAEALDEGSLDTAPACNPQAIIRDAEKVYADKIKEIDDANRALYRAIQRITTASGNFGQVICNPRATQANRCQAARSQANLAEEYKNAYIAYIKGLIEAVDKKYQALRTLNAAYIRAATCDKTGQAAIDARRTATTQRAAVTKTRLTGWVNSLKQISAAGGPISRAIGGLNGLKNSARANGIYCQGNIGALANLQTVINYIPDYIKELNDLKKEVDDEAKRLQTIIDGL